MRTKSQLGWPNLAHLPTLPLPVTDIFISNGKLEQVNRLCVIKHECLKKDIVQRTSSQQYTWKRARPDIIWLNVTGWTEMNLTRLSQITDKRTEWRKTVIVRPTVGVRTVKGNARQEKHSC